MSHHLGTPPTRAPQDEDGRQLTHREGEVLLLVKEGRTNRQIAEQLGISRDAVRFHLKEIHSKLETGGDRKQLTWKKAFGFATQLFVGAGGRLATAGVSVAMLGAGYLAYSSYSTGGENPIPDATETTTYMSWSGATLESFAVPGRISVDVLVDLNPGLGLGPIPPGTEVRVPVLPGSRRVEVRPTPPLE